MQPDIARSRDRSPKALVLKNEENMIEQILGLQIEEKWRIAMLFQNDSSPDRRLQAMNFVALSHFPE